MKNILLISLLFSFGISFTSCKDNKDEFLSDYSTILYFKNSGEVPLTLYKTGEDTEYKLTVNKAGSDLRSVTSVEVEVLDESAMADYNTKHGTQYVRLPDNCFRVSDSRVNFEADNLYKQVNVVFKTELICDLPVDVQYALPINLYNSKDSINSGKNETVLIPSVVIPYVYLKQTGYVANSFSPEGDETVQFALPITMPMDNKWTFDCVIGVDEELLKAYNEENGTNYSLLPASVYTLSGDGTVSFDPEVNEKNLDITVNRMALDYGNYVLPLRLMSCSKDGFIVDTDNNTCLYGFSYMPKEYPLTVDMLSSNAQEPNEGSLEGLLDEDIASFFHSAYSVAVEGDHYLQVSLPEEYSVFSFAYTTRKENGNGAPTEITVQTSMDGVTFNEVAVLKDGLPKEGSMDYVSPVFKGEPFKIIRLTMTKPNPVGEPCFVLSRFRLNTF